MRAAAEQHRQDQGAGLLDRGVVEGRPASERQYRRLSAGPFAEEASGVRLVEPVCGSRRLFQRALSTRNICGRSTTAISRARTRRIRTSRRCAISLPAPMSSTAPTTGRRRHRVVPVVFSERGPDRLGYIARMMAPSIRGRRRTRPYALRLSRSRMAGRRGRLRRRRPARSGPPFLTFTSAPLEHDLEMAGPLKLVLYAASSNPRHRFHRQAVRAIRRSRTGAAAAKACSRAHES